MCSLCRLYIPLFCARTILPKSVFCLPMWLSGWILRWNIFRHHDTKEATEEGQSFCQKKTLLRCRDRIGEKSKHDDKSHLKLSPIFLFAWCPFVPVVLTYLSLAFRKENTAREVRYVTEKIVRRQATWTYWVCAINGVVLIGTTVLAQYTYK